MSKDSLLSERTALTEAEIVFLRSLVRVAGERALSRATVEPTDGLVASAERIANLAAKLDRMGREVSE